MRNLFLLLAIVGAVEGVETIFLGPTAPSAGSNGT